MLNVYISPQSDSKKHEQSLVEKSAQVPIQICKELDCEHKRRKLLLANSLDANDFTILHSSDSACFIQDTIQDSAAYIENVFNENSDLYLALTTKTIYEQDVVSILIEFLKKRNYTNGLIEVFSTTLQELITNAVIHGNLELDLCLRNILDPAEFDAEKADELQQTFIKIQTLLDDPDYGLKPVILRLSCFDDAIIVDIQDQGKGFDFKSFQKKYHDTKFVKGMDLVFLMSKDVEYNEKTNTLSLVLEDPDKKPLYEMEVDFDAASIGVCTSDSKKMKKIKTLLQEIGIQNIERIPPEQPHWENVVNQIDLLLVLTDLQSDRMYNTVETIRRYVSKNEFPILCQKSDNIKPEQVKELVEKISDFISEDIDMGELSRRLIAHLSIQKAQQNFSDFYAYYQSEIIQSQKTIEHFETIDTMSVRDAEYKKKFLVFASGSQTIVGNIEDIDKEEERVSIPYGNGFSFSRGETSYFVFISMQNGLSSVLVSSYLKGYLDRLKDGKEYLTPLQIIHRVQGYAEEVIPVSIKLNIFCVSWDQEKNKFIYEKNGDFLTFKYQSKNHDIQKYKKEEQSDYYMIDETEILYIFDAKISVDQEKLLELSKQIFTRERKTFQNKDKTALNFYSEERRKIPYLAILPYKAKEKAA